MLSRRRQRRLWLLACALVCGVLPAGCSTVPSPGPSRAAVIDQGTEANAPYLLVPISDFAIEHLAKFPGPSLYGRFGDYRPALEQVIGVGDTLNVTIFEAAGGGLFSQPVSSDQTTGSHSAELPPQIVQQDGSITVPYAGRVNVVGKTTPQVEREIVQKLTGKAIEPQIVVTLDKNISTSVTVTGEVVKGERVPLSARGDRLLDVIADAGGINAPAYECFIELIRGGKTLRVPYQTLVNSPRENIFARPGDTITVVRYPLTFTAVGATLTNAVVPFEAVGISLEEAIGKAQGLIDQRADPEGVFVLRYEPISIARGLSRHHPGAGGARPRPGGLSHQHARYRGVVSRAALRGARQGHHLRLELAVQRPAEAVQPCLVAGSSGRPRSCRLPSLAGRHRQFGERPDHGFRADRVVEQQHGRKFRRRYRRQHRHRRDAVMCSSSGEELRRNS